jgi:hypothetical protein
VYRTHRHMWNIPVSYPLYIVYVDDHAVLRGGGGVGVGDVSAVLCAAGTVPPPPPPDCNSDSPQAQSGYMDDPIFEPSSPSVPLKHTHCS